MNELIETMRTIVQEQRIILAATETILEYMEKEAEKAIEKTLQNMYPTAAKGPFYD